MEVKAHLRFLRAAPRKVRLVADLIRGKDVQEAVNILHYTNKHAAKPLEKLLKSAIANAESREEPMDVDRLYVKEVFVDPGPSMKRIRPAPMGRAFRVVKRTAHLTVAVAERPSKVVAAAEPETERSARSASTPKRPRGAKPKAKPATGSGKKAPAKAKTAAKGGDKKKKAAKA